MKKTIYLIAIATTVALASCGNATTTTSNENDSTQTAENPTPASESDADSQTNKLGQVTEIVNSIIETINEMAQGDIIDLSQLDQKFCSNKILDLQQRIQKFDENAQGDMRFMGDEGYHWLLGLVPPFSVENLKVDFLSDTEAQVQLQIASLALGKAADIDEESIAGTTMILTLEDGTWKISNWLDPEAYDDGGYFSLLENYAINNNIPTTQP